MVALQKEERGEKKKLETVICLSATVTTRMGPAFTRRKGAEPTGSDIVPPPAEEMPSRVKNNLAL